MNDELFSPKLLANALDVEGVLDLEELYLIACSLAWNRSHNVRAGRELVRALASHDPMLREIAETALLERAEDSLGLVEGAVASGQLHPEQAGSCLQKLFLTALPDSGSSN